MDSKIMDSAKETEAKGLLSGKRQSELEKATPEKKPRVLRENDLKIWADKNNAASNQSAVDQKADQSNGQSKAHSNSQSNGYSNGQSYDHDRYAPNPWANGENRCRNRGFQRNDEHHIVQRLRSIAGPTIDMECAVYEEFQFSCRNRLYIGNVNADMTEEKLRELFKPYGEIKDVFIHAEKSFAFAKVDYHVNAEKAKRALDGSNVGGRTLRVRFATNQSTVRVGNLSLCVSNELLHKSFEIFGPVERATVTVDERGISKGEGIVEFVSKAAALLCMRVCKENCYCITSSSRPCIVEPIELIDVYSDGVPEATLPKNSQYKSERSVGPRFAELGSFEHDYGCKWKQIYAMYQAKSNALKRDQQFEEEKLDAQMDYLRHERDTEILRLELRQREAENERRKLELEMRQKQCNEFPSIDNSVMLRQNQMLEPIMGREPASYRRFKNKPQNYVHDNSGGFGRICEYSARSYSFEGNPFAVFPEHVSDERENDLPPVCNRTADSIEDGRLEKNEDNAFWSRRSM